MSVDWHSIRQNIATKAGSVTGVNFASADDTDSALEEPVVLVTDTGGIQVLERGPGYELRRAEVNGVLCVSRAALIGAASEEADDIVERLFVEFRDGIQLGYTGIVQDSWLESAQEDDDITVGGVEYIGYRLVWPVIVRENVSRSAT